MEMNAKKLLYKTDNRLKQRKTTHIVTNSKPKKTNSRLIEA